MTILTKNLWNKKIIGIRQYYDNSTLRDGVVLIIKKEDENVEYSISGTEWSTRCAEQSFDVLGIQLMKEQIQEISHLLNPNEN